MADIAYLRKTDQDHFTDLETMDTVFIENGPVRGRRTELEKLLEQAEEGDTVHVQSFSVLAGTTIELVEVLKRMQKKGVYVISRKEQMDTHTEDGRNMLATIAAVACFEQDVRTKSVSETNETVGKHSRKQKIVVPDFKDYYDLYMKRKISKSGIALKLNVSRPTVDRLVREYEASLGNR